jgi:xanthine dehydrogenase accessory factor
MIKGALAGRVQQLTEDRVPFVVATVVRANHPTSVRPGFSAVVLADGTIEGFVGGMCAESSVRLYSLRALETGEPLLLRLVPGDDDSPPAPDPSGAFEDAVVERNPCLSGGSLEIFLEPQLPAARIVIVGSAPIAAVLARVADASGYEVGDAVHPAGGDAALIVASHGGDEERVLAEALAAGVPYVALVASSGRGEAVRAALDVPDELRAQLHTPAGLDIGARTPEEIAISILAEVIAEHHAHPARVPDAVSSAVDPVCGMEVAVTDATSYLDLAGERIFFCSAGCRDEYATAHAAT